MASCCQVRGHRTGPSEELLPPEPHANPTDVFCPSKVVAHEDLVLTLDNKAARLG